MNNQIQSGDGSKPLNPNVNTKTHETSLNTFINSKIISDEKDLLKKHKEIHNWILQKYSNKNTQKTKLISLVYFLKKNKAPVEIIDIYSDKSTNLNEEVRKISKQNIGKNTEYTLTDIKNIGEVLSNDELNLDGLNKLLIILFNTKVPPKRTEISNVEIVEKLPNKKGNYLLKTKDGFNLVIQKSKVTKTYGEYNKPIPKRLAQIIELSLKSFPRKHLLAKNETEALGYQNYLRKIKEILGSSYSQNDFRRIYASDFFEKKNRSMQEIENLAKEMMTSADQLLTTYNKINITNKKELPPLEFEKIEVDTDKPFDQQLIPPVPAKRKSKFESEKPIPAPVAPPRKKLLEKQQQQVPKKLKSVDEIKQNAKDYNRKWISENKERRTKQLADNYQLNKDSRARKKVLLRISQGVQVLPATLAKWNITDEEFRKAKEILASRPK